MARFQFRLASLQRYREGLRDQCRQVLAQWLGRDAALAAEQQRLAAEREELLEEMRAAQQSAGLVDVEGLIARRYRAGQLSAEMQQLVLQRRQIAEQIALCRQALVRADQGVKVLEQLCDRQYAEFRASEEKREGCEREEIWQAGWLRET
jgi:flagellar export protein FliJ